MIQVTNSQQTGSFDCGGNCHLKSQFPKMRTQPAQTNKGKYVTFPKELAKVKQENDDFKDIICYKVAVEKKSVPPTVGCRLPPTCSQPLGSTLTGTKRQPTSVPPGFESRQPPPKRPHSQQQKSQQSPPQRPTFQSNTPHKSSLPKEEEYHSNHMQQPVLQHSSTPQFTLNQKELRCLICDVPCTSAFNLSQHLEGKKHKAKMDVLSGRKKKSGLDGNMDLWCRLCNVPCMNDFSLAQHRAGKNHAVRLIRSTIKFEAS